MARIHIRGTLAGAGALALVLTLPATGAHAAPSTEEHRVTRV